MDVPRGTAPKLWLSLDPSIWVLFWCGSKARKLSRESSELAVGVSSAKVCQRRPFTGRESISGLVIVLETAVAMGWSGAVTVISVVA